MVLGTLCAVVAIKGFMIPNHFLDGGITGIAILIYEFTHINVAIPLLILNLPFIWIGYKKVGKNFAASALLAIVLLAIFMVLVPVPMITQEKVLIAVFGGFFMGLGIGFVIRAGGVIDGLEVIADYTHKKSGITPAEIIMAINTLIFLIVAFKLGLDKAMYSILTFFTAIQVSHYVVDGFEEFTALTVISRKDDEIKDLIVNRFNKAISVYKGERGYLPGQFEVKNDVDIIVAVVTRLEIQKIKEAIFECDPTAFIYVQRIKDVGGGVVSRTQSH
ncbi:MAG: YitT family protein [Saprospiraceae bacterium]|nr:YitT family protein [Saprospiraceae bacterium]